MLKKILSMTLTALFILSVLTACAKKDGGKPIEAALEQNILEESARVHDNQVKDYNDKFDQIEIKRFPSLSTMLMELKAGRVDYLWLPASVGSYLAAGDNKMIVNISEKELRHFHMATRPEDKELWEEINKAIEELKADGTIKKLAEEYITKSNGTPVPKELEKFEDGDTHVVAVTGDLPPLDYVSADGNPAGFNVALLNAISEKIRCNLKIVQVEAPARLSALESKKVDMIFWIGCDVSDGIEPEAPGVRLTTAYYEESMCSAGYSAEILDKVTSIFNK